MPAEKQTKEWNDKLEKHTSSQKICNPGNWELEQED